MKNTEKRTGEPLEASPELKELLRQLSDLIEKFEGLQLAGAESFGLLVAIGITNEEMAGVKAKTARVSGGREFLECLIAVAELLKEENKPIFEL